MHRLYKSLPKERNCKTNMEKTGKGVERMLLLGNYFIVIMLIFIMLMRPKVTKG